MWATVLRFFTRFFEVSARVSSLLRRWSSAVITSARESRWGRLFTASFLFGVLTLSGDFLRLGLDQTVSLFKGLVSDPDLFSGGNILSWAGHSIQPMWTYLTGLFPDFFRWLGWWIGLDWIVWAVVCSAIFAFCGWLLSIFVKVIAGVVRLVLKFA